MKPLVFFRKLHRWMAIAVALPFLVVVVTGILLQLRGFLPRISPPLAHGTPGAPAISYEKLLEIARSVPELHVRDWRDVERIDLRPRHGVVTLRTLDDRNLQVDARTGRILRLDSRAAQWLVALHEGSWFHPKAALLVFLPTGILVLGLWLSGMLLWLPPLRKRKPNGEPG